MRLLAQLRRRPVQDGEVVTWLWIALAVVFVIAFVAWFAYGDGWRQR